MQDRRVVLCSRSSETEKKKRFSHAVRYLYVFDSEAAGNTAKQLKHRHGDVNGQVKQPRPILMINSRAVQHDHHPNREVNIYKDSETHQGLRAVN